MRDNVVVRRSSLPGERIYTLVVHHLRKHEFERRGPQQLNGGPFFLHSTAAHHTVAAFVASSVY